MYFRVLHDESTGSVTYVLGDLDAGEAIVVDPRGADVPVLQAMLADGGLRLRWVLRTHEHDEMLSGEPTALGALKAPVVQHRPPNPKNPVILFGNEHLRVLSTPGHTAGCLSYLWRDRLFCGGLLAVDACPYQRRPRLPEALWDSVTRDVFALPAETLVFRGHARGEGVVSSLLEQRRWHPWFAGITRDEFLDKVRALPALPTRPDAARSRAAPLPRDPVAASSRRQRDVGIASTAPRGGAADHT